MKILTGMIACGDEVYRKCAKRSAISFLDNTSGDLIIFTDDENYFTDIEDKYDKLKLFDYTRALKYCEIHDSDLISKITNKGREYYNHEYNPFYASMIIPFLQRYADTHNEHDFLLKIDADSYFVGDVIQYLINDIGDWAKFKDFFVVERIHPKMLRFDPNGAPGGGFILWRRRSRFHERYKLLFKENDQMAMWNLLKDGRILRPCRLLRPGYHFVYPFRADPNVTKEGLEKFTPAYFHLGGYDLEKQFNTMEKWFGKSGVNNE